MLGPRVGPRVGPAVGGAGPLGGAGDPMAAVTRDATSGEYFPANAAEWAVLLAELGDAAGGPSIVLNCQEANGNLTDAIAALVFAASGAGVTYADPVPGYTRDGLAAAEAATGKFTSTHASLPDLAATSMLVLAVQLIGEAGSFRNLQTLGTAVQVRGFVKPGPLLHFFHGANGAVGVADPTGVRFIWTQHNRTAGVGRQLTDQEIITPVFDATVTGKSLSIVGEANGAAPATTLYVAGFTGAAAQRSSAQIKAITEKMGRAVLW